jgi:N-methylhydantoinase B
MTDQNIHPSTNIDPVLIEVMRHQLVSVSEEMNITMGQTARSLAAKEGGDFSAALLDPQGNVIVQALPYGMAYFIETLPYVIGKYRVFQPGDIIISNDPFGGGSHLADIIVIMPLFHEGEHCGFAAVAEHHTDIGGRFPGGMGLECKEVYEEGLRLPAVKLYDGGRPNEAVREIISANVRAPDDVLGDLDAAASACRRGEQGLLALFACFGRDTVERYYRHLQWQTGQAMRDFIAAIPDGRYSAEEIDDGPGEPVKFVLTTVIEGDQMTIDFTGINPQINKAYNIPHSNAWLAIMIPMWSLLGRSDVVINSGLIAPIRLITPPGSIVNPNFPAATSARTFVRLGDLLLSALAQAIPERVPAGSEGGATLMIFTPAPIDGQPPGVLTEIFVTGGAGRPDKDGIDGIGGNGLRSVPGETVEVEMPVAREGFGLVPDSGGAGRFRGSLAIFRSWRYTAAGRVLLRTARISPPPQGRGGGAQGTLSEAVLISNGREQRLPRQPILDFEVQAGDVLSYVTPTPGGYGDPLLRDPALVLEDVLDEKLSASYAREVYGVAIDLARGKVDIEATNALRAPRLRA